MNLLKEKLNPNSEYNKKLRRDGIAMVKEMYKEAIECLEDCIKNQPCECRNEMRLAIEALEKQIPKKPIPQDEDCLECPNCDSFIGYASECKDEHYRVEYCPNCGQALKWE